MHACLFAIFMLVLVVDRIGGNYNSEPKLSRIKREYTDPRSSKHTQQIGQDLNDIRDIVVSNLSDILRRGENLDSTW